MPRAMPVLRPSHLFSHRRRGRGGGIEPRGLCGKGSISCDFEHWGPYALSFGSFFSGRAAAAWSILAAPLRTNARLPGKHALMMRTARRGSVIAMSAWICIENESTAVSALRALLLTAQM